MVNIKKRMFLNIFLGNSVITNYVVTRFAPLIDSIWHSVIKVAKEEDLIKTGIFGGAGKNLQKTLTRHHHTLKSSAQRRRKPYATPSKAISSSSTLTSTPLTTIKHSTSILSSAKRLNFEQESVIKRTLNTPKLKKVIILIKMFFINF